ncbi:uncharacterized protein, partial [Solanum tuberosum]|uniref:uncharacterized protein n=1 Tax=Solanum tuberosum TaxID=4113 RepID=UPI00073A1156
MAIPGDSAQSSDSVVPSIDSNHPLYMHPSDNPGAMLVSVPFAGIGYRSWRRSVLRSLSVKNKLGFINGECRRPKSIDPTYRQWERCDDIVTSWILNSLSKEIADSVEYVVDSTELWKELEDRYEQTNGAKLYQIQKEINDTSQGSLDITGYYTKLKKLWEELSTLSAKANCTCDCTCGAKAIVHKVEQDRRLIQFLMGLNEVYTIMRGSILMMNPLPSMAQAFSLLVQEEQQREIKPANHPNLESAALHVGTSRSSNYRTNYTTNTSKPSLQYKDKFCDYCKRTGHLVEKCYRLHGYPSNSNQTFNRQSSNPNSNKPVPNQRNNDYQGSNQRFNNVRGGHNPQGIRFKGNGHRAVANVHCAQDSENGKRSADNSNHEEMYSVNLTKDQYGRVQDMLQHFQGEHGDDGNSNFTGGTVDFADSGASNHMTFNISLLHNIITLPYPILVVLPNGYKVKGPSMKRPLVIGRAEDGLYFLCPKCVQSSNPSSSLFLKDSTSSSNLNLCNSCKPHVAADTSCLKNHKCTHYPEKGTLRNKDFVAKSHVPSFSASPSHLHNTVSDHHAHAKNDVNVLWHNRLGHVPFVKMKCISTIPANLWGPYHTPTHDHFKYFITIVDDFSRSTWTTLLSSKSNALQALKVFVAMIENQFNTTVKTVRTDNGLEFVNSETTLFFQTK